MLGLLAAAALVAVGLAASPASAAPTGVTLFGRVTVAENGAALAGVEVVLHTTGRTETTTTDDRGNYRLPTSPGTYDLTVKTANPCLVPFVARRVTVRDGESGDVRIDLQTATRTDRFGHACAPTGYAWVDTTAGTAVDLWRWTEVPLPFPFPYYGRPFQRVTVAAYDGLLGIGSGIAPCCVIGPLPSPSSPDSTIAVLAGEVRADEKSVASYLSTADRFVLTYGGLLVGDRRVSAQVHLAADGTIDLLYADRLPGSVPVVIGMESPDGTDGYQFHQDELASLAHTAWRFSPEVTNALNGTVVNLNDRLAVAGATVTAQPGGRSTVADRNGHYTLTVLPGRYTLAASSPGYGTATTMVDAHGGPVAVETLRLPAPVAVVAPATVDVPIGSDGSGRGVLTLTNPGGLPLSYAVYSRDGGTAAQPRTGPAPAVPLSFTPVQARNIALQRLGDDAPVTPYPAIVGLDGGANGDTVRLRIRFSPPTTLDRDNAVVWLDVDHNRTTGVSEIQTGFMGQNTLRLGLGAEYVLFFDTLHADSKVTLYRAGTNEVVATFASVLEGQSLTVDVPVALLPPTTGTGLIDVRAAMFNYHGGAGPLVPAPRAASIVPELAVPWFPMGPTSGVIPPGGVASIGVFPYRSATTPLHWVMLRVETGDPRRPTIQVPVRVHPGVPAPKP